MTEPVPLGHYFPDEPGPNAVPVTSTLELLIDTEASSSQFGCEDPLNRYRDKWWLPAAKTWRFQPRGEENGQPVKFLSES